MDEQRREHPGQKPADATTKATAAPAAAADGTELTDEQLDKVSGGTAGNATQMKKSLIGNFPR